MRVMASLLLLSLSSTALADTLPSFLNSNETIRNLPVPNLPADAYRPNAAPLQVPEPGATAAQPLLMGTKINLRTVQIEGGTLYPLNELAEIYKPLIGRESSLADLIEATRTITRRYQQDGYLLSSPSCRSRPSMTAWHAWCWWKATSATCRSRATWGGSKPCSTDWPPSSRPSALSHARRSSATPR